MTSQKRWKQLSGGQFFKFEAVGDSLEGIWRGTQTGKFGDNGAVESEGGVVHLFSLSAALKDLLRVKEGTEVRIEYLGKKMSKGGNEFKAFQVFVEDAAAIEDEEAPF